MHVFFPCADKTLYTKRNIEIFCPFQEYLYNEKFRSQHGSEKVS